MVTRMLLVIVAIALWAAVSVAASSDPLTTFEEFYSQMGGELSTKPPAELAEVSNFVYQKDVATFTFTDGIIYLLRKIDDRPTTALFIGHGHATITIPCHTERMSLVYASGDSTVDASFETAMFNFSDDFDLRLREKFTFQPTSLPWKDFNKCQQGEYYFQPQVMHQYDNYFQLLRSLYERKADGFFWGDFGRHTFMFDPNRPEQVIVGYEHEGGDQTVTEGVVMQRQEKGVYDDLRMSDIAYPTTALSCTGTMEMKGMDGQVIDKADVVFKVLLNADSLRFVTLLTHYNLKVDSVYFGGTPVHFNRRRDFTSLGIILPEYHHEGDTLVFHLWYHGKDFQTALPYVENPAPFMAEITIDAPKGYGYVAPGGMLEQSPDGKHTRYLAAPQDPIRLFQFQPYASGFDTIPAVSDIGVTVNFLKSANYTKSKFKDFVADNVYQPAVMNAFNFMTGRLGAPTSTFVVWVYPDGTKSLPGLICVPQIMQLVDGTGGLPMVAGNSAARQWFGPYMRPQTDREYWWLDAIPDYLSLMHVSEAIDPSVYVGELLKRRDLLYTIIERNKHWPLAAGHRADMDYRTIKGDWVVHMLRYLMYDLTTHSEQQFVGFLNDLKAYGTGASFSNEDVMKLAEKRYGASLDWFFKQWVFERDIPSYKVTYTIEPRADGNHVVADVAVSGISGDFKMPVIVRVEDTKGGSTYHRVNIDGPSAHFELGPFVDPPTRVVFNEFASVLSRDEVKKK